MGWQVGLRLSFFACSGQELWHRLYTGQMPFLSLSHKH